jgi:hypothetical protein
MARLHLFEIEDQNWCPPSLRKAMTEFLATVTRLTKLWRPTSSILRALMRESGENRIVVLGAGSGGGILDVLQDLPNDARITLTDLYPHQKFHIADKRVEYLSESIDATSVPEALTGIRVMYAAFHHLRPDLAKAVLNNAVKAKQPIAIFEGTERSLKGILVVVLVPLLVLLTTPFIRPFQWNRLVFTYIIPVLPLTIFWDGIVSAFRTYNVAEMHALTRDLPSYKWKALVLKGPRGEHLPDAHRYAKDSTLTQAFTRRPVHLGESSSCWILPRNAFLDWTGSRQIFYFRCVCSEKWARYLPPVMVK